MPLRRDLLAALGPPHVPGVVGVWHHGSRRLSVVVPPEGDVQVALYIPHEAGSPFEALFVVPEGEESEVAHEVSDFVERILGEDLVLAMDGRLVGGGRRWLQPTELGTAKHLTFVFSWKGSFDKRY